MAGVATARTAQGAGESVLAFRVSLVNEVAFPTEVSFNTSGAVGGASCTSGVDFYIPAAAGLTSTVGASGTVSGKLTISSAAADRTIYARVCPGSTASDKTLTLSWSDGVVTGTTTGIIRGAASTLLTNSVVLNDTGITTCANADTNGLACPQTGFAGQDAESGRDTDKIITGLGANKTTAFSYTALASGKCLQDNVTGLVWEGKTTDGGLHDVNATFTWFNSDATSNGGGSGTAAGGTCSGVTGGCDTEKLVAAVNAEALCGFTDWRVPSVQELSSLLDSGVTTGVAVNSAIAGGFVGTSYWTGTPKPGNNGAWIVEFGNGVVGSQLKSTATAVRLVRGR